MSSSQAPNHQGSEAAADLSYKERLDEAADKARYPNQDSIQNKPGVVTQIVEKVAQYVPGAESFIGGGSKAPEEDNKTGKIPDSVPPVRPHHDSHIEEFVRAQHGSKPEDLKAADE